MRRTLLALSLLPFAAHMQRYDCERSSVDPADCSLTPLSFLVKLSGVDAANFDVRKASAALDAAASAGSSSFVDFSLSVPLSGASTTQRVYGSTWIELADTDNKGRATLVGDSGRGSVRVHLSRRSRSPTQSSLLATIYFGSFHAANASAAVKAAAATADQLDVGTVWVVPLVGSSNVKVSISGPPSYAAVFVVRGETALETSHALLALTGSTAGLAGALESVGAAFQGAPSFTQNPQAPVVLLPVGTQRGNVSVNGTAVGEALSGAVSGSASGVSPPLNVSTTSTTTFQMQVNGSALNASDVEQAVSAGVAAAMNVSQDAVSVESIQTSANATDGNASTLQVTVTLQRDELYASNSSGETNSSGDGDHASATATSVDALPEAVAAHPAAVASAVSAQLIAAGESADNNVTVSEPEEVRTTTEVAAVIVSADVSTAATVAEAVSDSRVVNIPPVLQTAPAPPPPLSEGVGVGGVLAAAALGALVLMVF